MAAAFHVFYGSVTFIAEMRHHNSVKGLDNIANASDNIVQSDKTLRENCDRPLAMRFLMEQRVYSFVRSCC